MNTTEAPDRWRIFDATCDLAGIDDPLQKVVSFFRLPPELQDAIYGDIASHAESAEQRESAVT